MSSIFHCSCTRERTEAFHSSIRSREGPPPVRSRTQASKER